MIDLNASQQTPFIIFITGASGAGKTTLVNTLHKKLSGPDITYLHFDAIGVPSEEEMIKRFGSGSEWQKAMTYRWIKTLTTHYKNKKLVIFEGQVNIDFIIDAFQAFSFQNYKVILIHCDHSIRHNRLHQNRKQPELINKDMDNWSNFLKKQAQERSIKILDTTLMSVDETFQWFVTNEL